MTSKPKLDPNKALETYKELCLQQREGFIQLAQNLSEYTTGNSVDNEHFVSAASLPSSRINPLRSLRYHQDHAEHRGAGDGCPSSDDDGQPNGPLLPSSLHETQARSPGTPTPRPRPRQLKPKGASSNNSSSSRNAAENDELSAEVRATSSRHDRECKPGPLSERIPPLSLSKGNAAGGNQDGAENKALSMLTPTSGPYSSRLSLDLHSLGSSTSQESSTQYLDNILKVSNTKVSNTITSGRNFPSVCAPQKSSVSQGATHSTDDESELSDSIDYLDEDRKELDNINIRLVPVSKPRIRALFTSPTVYKMSSPVRGRALIINNNNFGSTMSARHGSRIDTKNIRNVLSRLSFDVQVHTDLSSQEMLRVIEEETKHPDHIHLGMFVLVIMTHGKEGHIFGTDGVAVNLSRVYDLISSYNFKAMAGKPKWVILQACSGERMDVESGYAPDSGGNVASADVQTPSSPPPSPSSPPRQYTADAPKRSNYLATDDLFITKASFHGYVSMRHPLNGSWLIRALVEALYKHSCHRDIETLFRHQVMKKVRTKSLAKRDAYLGSVSGQQPTMESFPTKGRKLYLFPGIDRL